MILFFVAIFYQLVEAEDETTDFTYNETQDIISVSGNQTLNSSVSEYYQDVDAGVFDINMVSGLIALIIGLVVIGVVAGIRVFGSGLSEFSVKLIYNSTTYYGIWAIFSVLSFGFFVEIPIFGILCWFALTMLYSLGFFETLHGGQ